ncbi:hypothetical protein D3C71_1789290 [compost metagenome]
MVIFAEPSNPTPFMVLTVANFVAVEAFPVSAPVKVGAETLESKEWLVPIKDIGAPVLFIKNVLLAAVP